jgi:hypothetical protein
LPPSPSHRRNGAGIRHTAHPRWEELLSQVNEINWAAELKKIEREFDGLPPEPPPAATRAKAESGRYRLEQRRQQEAAIGVYIRLVLVLALGVSVIYWPYGRSCGASLFLYLSSVTLVVIGGLWISASTWQNRMPRTHLLSMVIILWGLTLSALEVLPRAGYAQPDPARAAWHCE